MGSRACGLQQLQSVGLEHKLSTCGTHALLLLCMWDPPRSSIEPVSPELAGRFFITEPLGKPSYAHVFDEKAQPQSLKIAHRHIARMGKKLKTESLSLLSIHGIQPSSSFFGDPQKHQPSARPEIMDVKDRRHRSLTRGRCGKECRYTSSSLDSEDCRVPTQKSYSSSETLKAYDHDSRVHYGNRVTDLVHRESDEFPRQAAMELNKDIIIQDELEPNQSSINEQRTNFTLAELGICEPSPHRSGYCSDMGILHQGYSLSTGSDADSDTEGGMSPEHAIRLWGRGIKSRRSSGLSSRENSALTLTDSDNENKSDDENVKLFVKDQLTLQAGGEM
ncbi:hypothetical protein MJT46_007362 [Ovis ammon polii x Ovis aries]|nr:hypothetical protein MJT46_007362 [Ovis ammon polii x Ovis aries]